MAALNPSAGCPQSPTRILYDSSFSCVSGKVSGIERVVRSFQAQGLAIRTADPAQVEFVPVFAYRGAFYRIDKESERWFERAAAMERDVVSTLPFVFRLLAKLVSRLIPSRAVQRSLLPPSGHLGIFKPWHRRFKKRAFRQAAAHQMSLTLSSRDIVWLPDAYWAQPAVWSAAAAARRAGAMVGSLLYDLIPVRSDNSSPVFEDYLAHLLCQSDTILCISECERQRLFEYQAKRGLTAASCRDFRTIQLGCEFDDSQGAVRQAFQQVFADSNSQHVYLCVATFDPRKNHEYLLDVFDQLWAQGAKMRLCLVGRVGWECEATLQRIAMHPHRNSLLYVFHDATDAEVNYCYGQAWGVITASKDEGFGLPIVESLHRSRMTLASDIPVHREVGGQGCLYFDPFNQSALLSLITGLETTGVPAKRDRGAAPAPKSWRASYELCVAELLDVHQCSTAGLAASPIPFSPVAGAVGNKREARVA